MQAPQQAVDLNKPATDPLVWVVDSTYTGELNARIGLAERLGYAYEIIPLPGKDPQGYQHMLTELYTHQAQGCEPQLLVISGTGEETTSEIADLKSLFHDRLFNIYLASILPDEHHPRLMEYDLIASPQLVGTGIVSLVSVAHRLTQALLADAYRQHQDYFNQLPKPIIGLFLGGNTRYCDGFNEDHAKGLAQRVCNIAIPMGGCLVVSNSRRTPVQAQAALLDALKDLNYYFFDWQQTELSLYHALLAHADLFIVTGDSLSMCSEASFTGKPVLIDISKEATEGFHRDIVAKLIDFGAAKRLTGSFEPWASVATDPTQTIVDAIRHRIAC